MWSAASPWKTWNNVPVSKAQEALIGIVTSLQMRMQSFLPPMPTYTHAGGVTLGDTTSSSPDLYIEASRKEEKKDQTNAAFIYIYICG